MTNYLITGGCGFIGSNFIQYLLGLVPADVSVVNIDRLAYANWPPHHSGDNRYIFYKVDMNDSASVKKVLEEHKIGIVIHFAAQTQVDNSFYNSLAYSRDNILGTQTLAECCMSYGQVRRFIYMSTDEVYGEVANNQDECPEQAGLNPTNPYAATKASAEFLVRSFGHSFQFPFIIVRSNNVYGPGQYPHAIIPIFVDQIVKGKKCSIHGNGTVARRYIHVDDVCRALWVILQHGRVQEIYNVGSNDEFNAIQIHKMIMNIIRPGDDPNQFFCFVEDRPFNDRRYAVSTRKLQALSWHKQVTFHEGLRRTVRWYIEHSDDGSGQNTDCKMNGVKGK